MSNTAFSYSPGFEEAYFNSGTYLVQITKPRVNSRGAPCTTLVVKGSPDGRRINMRYIVNFHIHEGASDAARRTWSRQFDRLLKAVGIAGLEDMTELDGKEFAMYVYDDGYSPLPNPRPASFFTGLTEKAEPVPPTQNAVNEMNPPNFDEMDDAAWRDDIPF